MNPNTLVAFCFSLVVLANGSADVLAQQKSSSLDSNTEARLRAIYERGEFRAKEYPAKWQADSSRYIVRERDPETHKMVFLFYDVNTGKQIESKLADQNEPDARQLVSPDGRLRLEFRSRNLFVLSASTEL